MSVKYYKRNIYGGARRSYYLAILVKIIDNLRENLKYT